MSLTPIEKITFNVVDIWLDYLTRYTNVPGLQLCIRKKKDILWGLPKPSTMKSI